MILAWIASCAHDPPPAPAATGFVAGPLLDFDDALGPCMDAELADLDADGDLDVAVAMEFAANRVWWNDGGAVFTPEVLPGGNTDSEEVAALDVDADGDLDLLYVNEDQGGGGELYLREGDGWTDASDGLPAAGVFEGLAAADLDGDGLPEVVIAAFGPDVVWSANGDGTFRDVTADWLPAVDDQSQDAELADLDGDGDLDLVLANEQGDTRLLLQDGGTFVDVPFPTATLEESREVDAGDLDGDGDLDLVVANVGWGAGDPQDRWLVNDGAGAFVQGPRLPRDTYDTLDVDVADLDGDGDLDLVRANLDVLYGAFVPAPLEVWLNDGAGDFSRADPDFLPRTEGLGLDVEVGDLDGDGRDDLYLCARGTRDAVLLRR